MRTSSPIVTLTVNPCLDISARIDRLVPDRKLRCQDIRLEAGGGGINAGKAIVILGGTATAVFPRGGSSGELTEELLSKQGVTCHPIPIDEPIRESFAVVEQEEQKQYRFGFPGPRLPDTVYDTCLAVMTGLDPAPRLLVASGSLPPDAPADFYAALIRSMRRRQTRVVLDTTGEPLRQALEETPFVIKPNRRELEYVCDCSLAEHKEQERVCRELVDRGACTAVALTLGRDGALLTTEEEQFRLDGLDVEQNSSVGAGDSFVGAMTLALQRGETMRDAFTFGMAAGSAALLTPGTELCRKEDTGRLYRRLQEQIES